MGAAPTPALLKDAYRHGIFPWPHRDLPLLWFSPDPRFVLEPVHATLGRTLRKAMRRGAFEIRADTAFEEVMRRCGDAERPDQDGTWITPEMVDGFSALHKEGIAHSIEAWQDGVLVGGLYGISLGAAFFGESMFADQPDASKVAFATLLAHCVDWGISLVDCQVYTDHLARFGAEEWPREVFLEHLAAALETETKKGPWSLHLDGRAALDVLQAATAGAI